MNHERFQIEQNNSRKKFISASIFISFKQPVLAGACGSGNKDECYDELNACGQQQKPAI
jgi:hypothetical protein